MCAYVFDVYKPGMSVKISQLQGLRSKIMPMTVEFEL
jgi:hypothetical protein